jgi:Ser/Thr protein kinase RdoA (MazF antagonist)
LTATDPLAALAAASLHKFDLPDGAVPTLINVSENATYQVDDAKSGRRWALRIHRPGYHSPTAIQSELAWAKAVRDAGAAITPTVIAGRDGGMLQVVTHASVSRPRVAVLFEWEEGIEPAEGDVAAFGQLGEIAARMHEQVRTWERPKWFDRHVWDFETSLGSTPHWGRWRDGMGMTPETLAIFQRTVDLIQARLERFGMAPERFGLVHGDMRLANLLVDDGKVKVIDFDDCGFSWFLYDCAVTVSFFEHKPEVPDLLRAWVAGYRRVRPLCAEDEAEIPTFVMFRRLLLVAWIGSHHDTDLAQSMGVQYTADTVRLCERYLSELAI